MQTVKCVVIGDGVVGKTCMLMSYSANKFPDSYIPTVFDNYAVTVPVRGDNYVITLFDSAGQEEYASLRTLSYPKTNIFLICYDVTQHSSYENVQMKWVPEIQHHCPNAPYILVGTKIDLRENAETVAQLQGKSQRPLTYEDGAKLAKTVDAIKYVECSALTQKGLKDVFDEAILAALLQKSQVTKPRKKCTVL